MSELDNTVIGRDSHLLSRPCSLSECATLIGNILGEKAPAYITLKRWSASGRLDSAKIDSVHGRPRYLPVKILEMIDRPAAPHVVTGEGGSLCRADDSLSSPQSSISASDFALEIEGLKDSLRQIDARQRAVEVEVQKVAQHVKSIHSDLSNLNAIRVMMMNNTDSMVTMLKQRLAQAESQLRAQSSSDLDYIKLMRVLGQVEALLLDRRL